MPLIIPANTLSGGYEVSNSLLFNSGDPAQMSQGNGTQTNAKKWTISFWIKIAFSTTASAQRCVYSATGASSNGSFVQFSDTAMKIGCQGVSETDWVRFLGNPAIQFRDPSAWYHFCFGFDSTQSTDSNRIKSYVNGVQVDYLSGEGNYPAQNDDSNFNNGSDCQLGRNITTNSQHGDYYLSQFYFIDGTQYAASDFGETNDNGVWIPKAFSGTFGNNGTFVEGDSNTADASGNGNNFGQSNVEVTTDTPTNNFATWNSLNKASNVTLSEGNCKAAIAGTGQSRSIMSTIAVASGKWYWEIKYTTDVEAGFVSVITTDFNVSGSSLSNNGSGDNVGYISGGNKYINGSATSYGDGWDDGDIVGVALNIDDNEVVFYKNGTAQNSGTAISKTFSGFYYASAQHTSSSGTSNFEANFGNPSFSISSGNADANGYGNFEYAVPSGFYALCTKNLAEYG